MPQTTGLLGLIDLCRRKQLTLAFAESCTGGLLSSTLAAVPGVSDIYLGTVVAYAYQAKSDILQVPSQDIQSHGAVSQSVALSMARGARKLFHSYWSVAITGIAGPGGATPDKPVGTVWFGVAGPNFEGAEQKLFQGERQMIQRQSADFAIELLLNNIARR